MQSSDEFPSREGGFASTLHHCLACGRNSGVGNNGVGIEAKDLPDVVLAFGRTTS